jgi:hypothetical protein
MGKTYKEDEVANLNVSKIVMKCKINITSPMHKNALISLISEQTQSFSESLMVGNK